MYGYGRRVDGARDLPIVPPIPPVGLRELREACGLSVYEVAERSGVGIGVLLRLEAGNGPAHPVTVGRLAPVLGLTPSELHRRIRAHRAPKGARGLPSHAV
jgi:transcriptional regulator with XRE-family HTH domain